MAITSSRVAQSRRWLTLPDGWDYGWRQALSTVASSPANVAVIGDSNAQGWQSSNHLTKPYPALLRNVLATKYGSYADYYPVSQSARYNTQLGGSAPPAGSAWTFDTTWGGQTFGMNQMGFAHTIFQDIGTFPIAWNNAGSGTFTTPYACTAFDIIHHDWNTTGTWKYNIDNAAGAGLVTVTNDARNSVRRTAVTGQTNAVHTVRFGNPSVQYALGLNGIVTYNPATSNRGIGFANTGASASAMIHWLSSAYQSPADRAQQWQGRYKTATATEVLTGFGFPTQPHLAIIQLGINDCGGSNGLVHFRLGLRKMCDAIRRGRDSASIMFLIAPNPTTVDSDQTTQFGRAESWSLYADQIYSVAAEYQCAVFNVHADWMSTPVAQGFTTATDPHPTDAGHQQMADVLASVIS